MTQRTLEGATADVPAAPVPEAPACARSGVAHDWKARADGSLRCRGCGVTLPGGTEWAAMAWYEDNVQPRAKEARRDFWRQKEGGA